VLRLSVLDQSPVPAGSTSADALRNTVDLAQLAERLGYHRYWLAEHHNTTGLSGSTPEVLIAHVATQTNAIRVGSGGVMLSHYSSLKVAENFRMLNALHPDRIDLGVGRAPGSDPLTARALQRNRSLPVDDDFPQQVSELIAFLGDRFDPAHPFSRITATPKAPGMPEVWLLGSTAYSAACAAYVGGKFAFAHFINPSQGPSAMGFYRDEFQSTDPAAKPEALVAAGVIGADTDEEAERLASSVKLWRLQLDKGDPGQVPSVEEALGRQYSDMERARMAQSSDRLIIGGPDRVKAELEKLADTYGVEEVMVVTIVPDHQARRRSYELLAKSMPQG
jgi:luciferase family oxidoreductase group 1